MGATPVLRRRARSERLRASAKRRAVTPAEAAWIAALPCTVVIVLGMLSLGPPLAHAFLMPRVNVFWPSLKVSPQPEEHGRILIALLGPPLLTAAVLAQASPRIRGRLELRANTIRALVLVAQATLIAFIVICFAAQNEIVLDARFPRTDNSTYFRWPTLLVAVLAPAALLAALRGRSVAATLARRARETPTRRRVCLAAAVLWTALWMTTAINLDSSVGSTISAVSGHILWTMAEPFAVLDGRTPLVDYHAQYGQLWAYLAAGPMALFGATIFTYTLTMATGTGLSIFAVYAIFRRLTGSSIAALALYAPFVATAFFTIIGPLTNRYGPQNLYLLWPIRYAGPLLLAWLSARHVDGAAPRRAWVVFVVAGLVVINNPDWGIAGGLATFAALAAAGPLTRRALARLTLHAAAGAALALLAISLLTLVRAGSLPRLWLLTEFSRLYGIDGWGQLPIPELGLHVLVFLTFVAALVTAATRVVRRAQRRLLTSMLAWIGVFGLSASLYYIGRAHPLTLFDFFAPWAFAIILLLLVVLPGLDARTWHRPTLPELVLLFSLGLIICSLPQTPTPWSQLARLRDRTPTPVFKQASLVRLVEQTSAPGEHVAILAPLGHRVAYDAGVTNLFPYSSTESVPTSAMLRRAIAALRREGAHRLYVSLEFTRPEQGDVLEAAGFKPDRPDTTGRFALLTDGG